VSGRSAAQTKMPAESLKRCIPSEGSSHRHDLGGSMSKYAAARLDQIEELTDGRCPWRPVRHHFGITSFGINAWTGREAGDRIINEHDESDADDQQEELYFVQ
jgi:hypothetical protein